jgi:hypothetical protein
VNGFGGDAGDGGDGGLPDDSGNLPFKDGTADTAPPVGALLIYANTDNELYTMNPTTKAVTLVGPFDDGTTTRGNVTDLAVNAAGDVWVNTDSAIYRATVPNGPGTVVLTKVTDITLKSTQHFFALGFTLAGTLGVGETLVAGDNLGDLYAVESNGTTQLLGGFGTGSGNVHYELSGDVMFFSVNGQARGLATIRSCAGTNCTTTNDLLAEIDVAAMATAYKTKTPASLRKGLLGGGTGFGKLFGVGAWNDSVYAFSRVVGTTTPPQLIQIGVNGTGTMLKDFPQITSGWSGAGVTTSAPITILPN